LKFLYILLSVFGSLFVLGFCER